MKRSQQGFIIPLLIIIIAALAIGGGVYEYQKNKEVQSSSSTSASTTLTTNQSTNQQSVNQSSSQTSTQTQSNTPVTSVTNSSNISVSGMSKYVDADFGFSFWYPSNWTLQTPVPTNSFITGGTIVKKITVAPANASANGDGVSIEEFVSTGSNIAGSGITDNHDAGPAGNGSLSLTYFFDPKIHTWISQDIDADYVTTTKPADVSTNSMGGLHILYGNARFGDDRIIPLSAEHFLVISDLGTGTGEVLPLANTVVALDPSVATPISAAQQIQTIQAEAQAYQALTTPITTPQKTYTDIQYGYSIKYPDTTKIPYAWARGSSNVGTPLISVPVKAVGYGSGEVDIGLSTNANDIANCVVVPPSTEIIYVPQGNVSIAGTTFLHFSSYEPALGQERTTDSYRVIHNRACWNIDVNLDGTEANRLTASQAAQEANDYATVKAELNSVLRSFVFLNLNE